MDEKKLINFKHDSQNHIIQLSENQREFLEAILHILDEDIARAEGRNKHDDTS